MKSNQPIQLWSLPDGKLLKSLKGEKKMIYALAIRPAGDLLVAEMDTAGVDIACICGTDEKTMQQEIEKAGGLAEALHAAVSDPAARRLQVVYVGPKPDLLRHEAQAIVTGHLGEDGVFYADELLLKCPTRYEEEVPLQVEQG